MIGADETERDVDLTHTGQVKTRFEQKDRDKARGIGLVKAIDAILESSAFLDPLLVQTTNEPRASTKAITTRVMMLTKRKPFGKVKLKRNATIPAKIKRATDKA